ncbi:3-phosphoshikimate 1-carboxyvinyltransferase [Streptomyces angustmyceticus]|uniref:3-phosphoshikimate 1-carboxyvinyltransferase n=1 Tax=Streptomyces angustmyceticus TaxID=285578 RepID=UPI0036CD5607
MNKTSISPAAQGISGTARIPQSKPHMQRALLLSLLANAPSVIVDPAWSSEARSLFESVQEFGLNISHHDTNMLGVSGVGKSLSAKSAKVSVVGSAFNFRTMAAVACLSPGETVLEGNASMLSRPVREFLSFIPELGGSVDDISDTAHLRVRVRGSRHLGGTTTVDTRHSSQVLTSVLLVAPLADEAVRIQCTDPGPVGEGYVDLTVAMMQEQGAHVERDGSAFLVRPSTYRSRVHHLASDFTALSYLAGTVATARAGQLTIADYHPSALSSESEFLRVLDQIGIRTEYDPVQRALHIDRTSPAAPHVEIDGRNIPTVVPTLAAVAPFIDARVTLRNAAHVNNHKCRRVEVMVGELRQMGCVIDPTYDSTGRIDGFTTQGQQSPVGGTAVDSHGDHRIFLSLATAALGCRRPTVIDGAEHLPASFPDYLDTLAGIGATVTGAPARNDLITT